MGEGKVGEGKVGEGKGRGGGNTSDFRTLSSNFRVGVGGCLVRGIGTKDNPFVLALGLAKLPLKKPGVLTPHLHKNDGVTHLPLTQAELFWPFSGMTESPFFTGSDSERS